jgi:hypothetical protein
MIDEADRDGDGEIGEEDFIRIMKKTNLFWYTSLYELHTFAHIIIFAWLGFHRDYVAEEYLD